MRRFGPVMPGGIPSTPRIQISPPSKETLVDRAGDCGRMTTPRRPGSIGNIVAGEAVRLPGSVMTER